MKKRTAQSKRRPVEVIESTYQPTRAELREEIDMPGASLKTLRQAFFRPVTRKAAAKRSR